MNRIAPTWISYLGRRSGLPHTCRVQASHLGTDFLLRVPKIEERRWWRNFLSPWPVSVLHAGRVIHGRGQVVCGKRFTFVRVTPAH